MILVETWRLARKGERLRWVHCMHLCCDDGEDVVRRRVVEVSCCCFLVFMEVCRNEEVVME